MKAGYLFVFFNDTATTEIYTLSLHDALPISGGRLRRSGTARGQRAIYYWPAGRADRLRLAQSRAWSEGAGPPRRAHHQDRKSTRLNSSHANISYAVFCLKKK